MLIDMLLIYFASLNPSVPSSLNSQASPCFNFCLHPQAAASEAELSSQDPQKPSVKPPTEIGASSSDPRRSKSSSLAS